MESEDDWRAQIFAALKTADIRQVGYVPDAGHAMTELGNVSELISATRRLAGLPLV